MFENRLAKRRISSYLVGGRTIQLCNLRLHTYLSYAFNAVICGTYALEQKKDYYYRTQLCIFFLYNSKQLVKELLDVPTVRISEHCEMLAVC